MCNTCATKRTAFNFLMYAESLTRGSNRLCPTRVCIVYAWFYMVLFRFGNTVTPI
jgi:hypothetical protein